MSRRTIAVVAGGLRQPSSTRLLADRLAEATATSLRERGIDADVTFVELREHAHDLTNTLLTGLVSADLKRAIDTVVQADGVIAVTPIFSGSYSGLFKNFFDGLEPGSLAAMPVLIGATAGTTRHSLALEHALRPLFTYLHAVVVPTSVFGATEDFGATSSEQVPDDVPPLQVRVERAAGELADLVAARSPHRVADPFAHPTSFADLLAGL